jgi:hypothetical protein
LVANALDRDPKSAAGNDGAFSLLAGLAIGCAFAGLLELTRTFNAFGNLQFVPTEATERMFVAWTWAMLSAPVSVIASAILITIAVARLRSGPMLISAAVSLVATGWLAARVWENVTGYLVADPNGPPAAASPLAPERWPLVYNQGIAVLIGGLFVALCGISYALWRARPRAILFPAGVLLALGAVYGCGQLGFSAVAFLRLRNIAAAVAIADAILLALALRRRFDVVLLIAFLVVAVSAWQLAVSWQQMLPEMPHGIDFPRW